MICLNYSRSPCDPVVQRIDLGKNDDLNRGITNITHYDNLGPPVKQRPNKKLKKTQAVIFS